MHEMEWGKILDDRRTAFYWCGESTEKLRAVQNCNSTGGDAAIRR